MPQLSIQTIAVVVNPLKAGGNDLAAGIKEQAESMGVSVRRLDDFPLQMGSLEGVDICCVIGGDGTILGAVPEASRSDTPILGINLGKLGFLATYNPEGILDQIKNVLLGNFCFDERSAIEVYCGKGHCDSRFIALNDVVIKSTTINLINLQVSEGGQRMVDYNCDGLIFATPTGSTAYNLSAGGPILHPQNNSIAMTPICAHTLSNRSFIFPGESNLQVQCNTELYDASISIDGRPLAQTSCLFPFHIRMAKHPIKLIHAPGYSHYQTLRTKLKWM